MDARTHKQERKAQNCWISVDSAKTASFLHYMDLFDIKVNIKNIT